MSILADMLNEVFIEERKRDKFVDVTAEDVKNAIADAYEHLEEGGKRMNEANWPFVATELKAKAELFNERHKDYGDNYKHFGYIMGQLFTNGEMFDTRNPDTMNRLGIFVQMITKLTRYAQNFHKGGHDDSLDDLVVYAMMLKELDVEVRARESAKEHIAKYRAREKGK